MKTYFLKGLLNNDGWHENVYVSLDEFGIIESIGTEEIKDAEHLDCYAIPGFQNAHSHAFQYAMAGLAENHSTGQTPDDFWSWRDAMYQLALSISPDDLEVIATQLYSEMLRHGYTEVAEFHYVHHDKNGRKFANLSEMGERLVSAAKKTGIGITLIPIFYQKGGFGKEPTEGQKRFISASIEEYYDLYNAADKSCSSYHHANVAIGIHSMRGVEPKDIIKVANEGFTKPSFHIHIAEQLKEIEDSVDYLGKRPVEWMLENINLSDRFHMVHATHLTDGEVKGLAESGANVVLCPSTEGNLGDGIFPLKAFQDYGGEWSIGTDSHVGLNPFEELRLLDYGQRLVSHKRNTFYNQKQGDSGYYGLDMAVRTGRKAMGSYRHKFFEVGGYFDACLLRADEALIATTSLSRMSSTLLYSTDSKMQYGTISKGKLVVADGKHLKGEKFAEDFKKTISQLGNR